MKKIFLMAFLSLLLVLPGQALAIPNLQLFIEGAAYGDRGMDEDTWFSSANPFKLWVLGETKNNPRATVVPITAVYLLVTYPSGEMGTLSFTPTTVSPAYLPYVGQDPSTPSMPTLAGSGNWPNISLLAPHYPAQAGFSYLMYRLDDFGDPDSRFGDWMGGYPSPPSYDNGQIHAFEVAFSGYSMLHFDVIGMKDGSKINNPFSHDATVVPLPGSLLLLGPGLLGLLGLRRRLS